MRSTGLDPVLFVGQRARSQSSSYFFFSFFLFLFSLIVNLGFFCVSFFALSFFPFSPISTSYALEMAQSVGLFSSVTQHGVRLQKRVNRVSMAF